METEGIVSQRGSGTDAVGWPGNPGSSQRGVTLDRHGPLPALTVESGLRGEQRMHRTGWEVFRDEYGVTKNHRLE